MEREIDTALAASRVDRDAADKCKNRLLDLKTAIDEVEDSLEWPALLADAEETLKTTKDINEKYGTSIDKQKMAIIERELRRAMESRDTDLLNRKIGEANDLKFQILREQPGWWVANFEYVAGMKSTMHDQSQAEQLIAQGRRAINGNDLQQLKSIVSQLINLLPAAEQQAASNYGHGGTTTIF